VAVDFRKRADEAASQAESQKRMQQELQASLPAKRQQLESILTPIGRDAASYLAAAGVELTPVGKVLDPLPWSKRQRIQELDRAWLIEPESGLSLSRSGSEWRVYSKSSIREFKGRGIANRGSWDSFSRVGTILNSYGALQLLDVLTPGPWSSIRVGRDDNHRFHFSSSELTVTPGYGPMYGKAIPFGDWIADLVGKLSTT